YLKWQDIQTLYHRLPNVIWMDYYERGYNRSSNPADPPAPALFLNYLNALWSVQPAITPVFQLTPRPTAYGWNKTNVQVMLSGTGDAIQAITARAFGASNSTVATRSTYSLQTEGITTVSFS